MKKRIIFLIAAFFIWLPLLVIQKPAFMLFHHALAEGVTFTDYMLVMWHGLPLDCTIAGYLTIIPFLCTIVYIWLPGKFWNKVIKIYFLIVSILVALIFVVDEALYSFWGFRLDATLFFYLKSPADAMASVPLGLAAVQIIQGAIYAILMFLALKKFVLSLFPLDAISSAVNKLSASLVTLLLGGIMFIPIRGGVTTSTANIGMVYFSDNQFLNHSAVNPCFSLLSSLGKQQDFSSQFNFFSEGQRKSIYQTQILQGDSTSLSISDSTKLLRTDRPNILIIVMESFSANVVGAVGGDSTVTPNLNRIAREGVLFTNIYANSFRTDRGLVAVLNGYLAQPTTSIMKYPEKSRTLPSIAKSLGRVGYVSDMLYGGDINFTNMRSYFFSSGYSHITSDVNFPLNKRLSKWGANDDVTFQHLYEMFKSRPVDKHFMTTFLTLSSHEPFKVPYHRLTELYPNSVAFADSCMGHFIEQIKQLPIWKNLLVIFVSDHGYRYPDNIQEFGPRRFHIPMIWTGGAVAHPCVISTIANQTDLAATLLQQLHLPHNEFVFSKDIFNPAYPEHAFYSFPNGFGYVDSTGISVFDNEGNKPLIETPKENSSSRLEKGKAILQTLYDDLENR